MLVYQRVLIIWLLNAHMLHGAGIFTYITGWFILGKCCKYSSTMGHIEYKRDKVKGHMWKKQAYDIEWTWWWMSTGQTNPWKIKTTCFFDFVTRGNGFSYDYGYDDYDMMTRDMMTNNELWKICKNEAWPLKICWCCCTDDKWYWHSMVWVASLIQKYNSPLYIW